MRRPGKFKVVHKFLIDGFLTWSGGVFLSSSSDVGSVLAAAEAEEAVALELLLGLGEALEDGDRK